MDWLDRLTFREVEVVNEKSKRVGSSFHLTLEFPPVRLVNTAASTGKKRRYWEPGSIEKQVVLGNIFDTSQVNYH